MTLRQATQDDIARIAAIHTASWRDTYATFLDATFLNEGVEADHLALWTARLTTPTAGKSVLLAGQDGATVGFISIFLDDDPRWGSRIDNLHVLPGHRGQGVGDRLLRRAASDVGRSPHGSALYLWVFEANDGARRFYRRNGAVEAERSVSLIPSARGKSVLRLYWPDVGLLANS